MRSMIRIISLMLVCCAIGWAQSDRGSITGTITDSTGGIVPDASVTATNTATNVVSRTATNESGVYAIPALLPGTYKVRVEKNGFKAAEQAQVVLAASSTVRVDIGLQVGEVSESVDVSASVTQLQSGLLRIAIHEGRNRQVRRMCDAVGYPVERLVRVRIGPLRDTRLRPGRWRALTPKEVRGLQEAVAPDHPPWEPEAPSH